MMAKSGNFIKYNGKQFEDMIIQTLDLASGLWYLCPKGHKYCISDNGQSMLKNKCPECALKQEDM